MRQHDNVRYLPRGGKAQPRIGLRAAVIIGLALNGTIIAIGIFMAALVVHFQ